MELKELEAAIEAILFTCGEAIETDRLALALEMDEDTIRKVCRNMVDKYEGGDRGIQMLEINNSFQLCTKPDMYEHIIKITHVPKKHVLTEVLLETLSIIAYKQPITRSSIESIRGVNCEHAVNKLIEYELIHEVGRLDAPGRPILFGTTNDFLRNFGLKTIDDLPVVLPDKIEDFRIEAEEEIQLKLNLD